MSCLNQVHLNFKNTVYHDKRNPIIVFVNMWSGIFADRIEMFIIPSCFYPSIRQ